MLKAFACLAGTCLGPRRTRMVDPARRTHFPNAACRGLASDAARGCEGRERDRQRIGNSKTWTITSRWFSEPGGGQFIQILIVRPASRREARVLELVVPEPASRVGVLRDLFYVLMKRLRDSSILGHPLLPSLDSPWEMTIKDHILLHVVEQRNPTSHNPHRRTVRNTFNKIRLTPLPPDSAMSPRAAPRRTPHCWQ